jgi:hypothetical protein
MLAALVVCEEAVLGAGDLLVKLAGSNCNNCGDALI